MPVLTIKNVPFPESFVPAANLNVTHTKEIAEFTFCYRFLITSYNEQWNRLILARQPHKYCYYEESFGFNTGFEFEGYQPIHHLVDRNVTGGGVGKGRGRGAHPMYHHTLLARNIQTGKWVHTCNAYSSSLQKMHLYIDGLKAFSYQYTDEEDNPLPSTLFANTDIGQNMRGLVTDMNIYSRFFTETEMVTWTTNCGQVEGDIYAWDTSRLNLTQKQESNLKVTLVKMPKADVCPDPDEPKILQEPSKLGATQEQKRYKPKNKDSSTFVGKVLELITDPFEKIDTLQSKDRCFRLDGEILSLPQNEEEEKLMDQVMWNYLMKKIGNDLKKLKKLKVVINVGGETKDDIIEAFEDLEAFDKSREGLFPKGGYYKYYHPVTGEPMNPNIPMLIPTHNTFSTVVKMCNVCFTSFGPYRDYPDICETWECVNGGKAWCHQQSCRSVRQNDGMVCAFNKEASFNIRGLCKEAVMDTQYKFADYTPAKTITYGYMIVKFGLDNSRQFVGPKGWIISRNEFNKRWQMNHTHYPDLTLTMLDMDALPVGRHNWLIENNACNQGETSSQVLLMSACKESEFTCDDGKCLNITQRCNNIEVKYILQ